MSLENELLELIQVARKRDMSDAEGFLKRAYDSQRAVATSQFDPRLHPEGAEAAVDAFLETSGYYGQRVRAALKTYLKIAAEAATSDIKNDPWGNQVIAVVDQAHAENWGGKHRTGFCEACADAHLVAQNAIPR
jgi:hypothetical protein